MTTNTALKESLVRSQTPVPAGRAGGLYDLVVSAGFATPWTAGLMLSLLSSIHDTLGLPGDAMPDFETSHLLFVSLFGVVVTMWSAVRVIWPSPLLIAADTVGRGAFALTFVWAIVSGHSTVIVAFLVLELAWLVAQARGVLKVIRAASDRPAGRASVEVVPA